MNKERIYKILIVFFLAIFLSNLIFAQKRKKYDLIPANSPFYFETHILPADSSFICYLSYKIPFNTLLFVKENSHYSSGYSVTFEIYEKEKFVKRIIGKGEVFAQNYTNTFNDNLYHEGLIVFNIGEGDYLIKPSIILNNTTIEASIKPVKFRANSDQINNPIFVSRRKSLCDSAKYELVNYQNSIPFSENEIDLLIPIYQKSENSVNIQIFQNDKKILDKTTSDFDSLDMRITKCNEQIVLSEKSDFGLIKFYKANYINQNLREGEIEIKLQIGSENIIYNCPVVWYNKPKSLINIEKAIEYLGIIGLKQSADSLLDFPEELQYNALYDFWKKFDVDETTSFNTVLDEFYTRIDYVKKQFDSIGESNGEETDRGRIYILYGKPDNIERTFNDLYDVIEIWEYKSLNKKMYFSDKTGTGQFERIK